MKKKITLLLFSLVLISHAITAQIAISSNVFNWSKIEDSSPISINYSDGDNGDGLNDGAMVLNSSATTPSLQGLQYLLAGSPISGEQINLETKYFQIGSSYVGLKLQVYDLTDNVVLAQSGGVITSSGVVGALSLSHTFTTASVGHQIMLRIIRADDLSPVRQAGIDYLKVNGQFISMLPPPAVPITIDPSAYNWSRIESNNPVTLVSTDADNGDGLNDGALLVNGAASTPALQGLQYLLKGDPFKNGKIDIELKYYQNSASYAGLKIQVYNVTDDVVLAESTGFITTSGVVSTKTFSYVFTADSAGDQIMLRFVRWDDLSPSRVAVLDYLKVNGQFIAMKEPPAPPVPFDVSTYNWSKIDNTTPIALAFNDADNGDGLNDGAMPIGLNGIAGGLQGVQYVLTGNPFAKGKIDLEVNYYQGTSSYACFKVQVYNVSDNLVLAESPLYCTSTGVVKTGAFSYVFGAASEGDQIILRFVRADDLSTSRLPMLDYVKVNGQFIAMKEPPAPPVPFDVSAFNWSKIDNDTQIALSFSDADNGDGLNDGAMPIGLTSTTSNLHGVQYLLTGSPFVKGGIDVEVNYYQGTSSYACFKVQVFNVTDNLVLAESPLYCTSSGVVSTKTFSYVFKADSAGDQIMLRFVRADDFSGSRVPVLDYVKVNGQFINMYEECKPIFNFDIPLTSATPSEINDLATIRTNLSNEILGTEAPTAEQLATAIAQYDALNIVVDGNKISGNPITSPTQIVFLMTFAKHLKFNPTDTSIISKAVNAVWYFGKQNCNRVNPALTFYNFPGFSRAAIYLNNYLPDHVKQLFGHALYVETGSFALFFEPEYDFNVSQFKAISTDLMFLDLDVLLAYADWFPTDDEKIRYLKTAKRYIERCLIHTYGLSDGLKKDGLSFHHVAAYDGYMYAFDIVSKTVKSLSGTAFQIDQPSYFRFRDAVYAQAMYTNDEGVLPFAMAGRNPHVKHSTLSSITLGNVAIAGGAVLGLNGADPVLAGIYNRKYGVNSQFNNSTITPFEEAYVQFNYGNLGVYRKNNWIASMKGQSNQLWGSEIYQTQNRFGRYQSYGALEIMYPGNSSTGNGFSEIGWDWNYNPGTTTIVLPWSKLHAEKSRVDEYNTYGFAGSLALDKLNKGVLSSTTGQSGLFSMKFKERNNLGFGTVYGPDTHNATFEFTKTYFAVDDFIICLASGIKNNDTVNPTVTTLFQRLNNNSSDVLVNGMVKTNQSEDSFDGTAVNWIIDNYNTGYYILPNSGTLKIKNSLQITPYAGQVNPSDATIATNNGNNYHLAYLDHGTAPTDNSYEFICVPSVDNAKMTEFAQRMQSDKPYTVYQNNVSQQIIEHKPSKTWAYALPAANDVITDGFIKANDTPCLVMYKSLKGNYSEIVLSVSNPDMGVNPSAVKTITLTLNHEWAISQAHSNANVGSATAEGTTVTFTLADGFPVEIKLKVVNPCALPNAIPVAPTVEITQPTLAIATGSITVTSGNTNLSFGLDGVTFDNTSGVFENLNSGSYTVYAKNEDGCISEAANATINPQPVAPTVSLSSPSANASYDALANIIITADAADADGSVSKVEFFNGATKLGEDLIAPYSFEWNNVAVGSYILTVKATDNDDITTTSEIVNINVVCPTVQLSIPDVYAMNPAIDDINTIYLGYGPTSLTLNALAQGGQDCTYSWSSGVTGSSISVSQAETYTVTASYAGSCQSTASIAIDVLDVRCGQNNDKVMICHNNNVICVARSAVQNHLDHGDNLGSCNGTSKMAAKQEVVVNSSDFTVYPNPVQDSFNISVSSKLDPNATIGIYNILGNKIRQVHFTVLPQNVFIGDLPSGNYIVVIQNGVETFRSTIVKQ